MSMKTTAMTVAAVLMSVGVAAADDLNGDLPPQPSAIGNGIVTIVNEIKHATDDVAGQEQIDRVQTLKLQKSLDKRIAELEKQRKAVQALQRQELNASVKAAKAKGEDKEQQAADLKAIADELKVADKELGEATKTVREMNSQIAKVAATKDPVQLNKSWEMVRAKLGSVNEKVRQQVDGAIKKANHADEVMKKYAGSSTSSGGDVVGAFKVTLKSWSCKKTEIYLGDAQYPKASKVGDSIGASKDGVFSMHVMIVGSRREQARKYEALRAKGQGDTASIKVTAASNWILNYEMVSGHKTTDWRVEKEDYDWKAPEGKSKIDYKVVASGANNKSKTDAIEITFPTAAATNSIHGWVRGEINWKGAQDEQDSEDCSYDLTIEPKH
ncbi:MAG TPA: hypothetical protein VL326_05980 [Kofleriaceae bacterium]|nr:hypothetical protein [Kofleriaceae bacterium]